ncbi:MAG TPA: DUF2254 domain-containing protein [Acidimicrobiales bacterium]|nr:DUF2254 domain-containing protein [Acidimicrobiales bacterium]
MSAVLAPLRRWWSGLVSGYWFIPASILVVVSALAFGLVAVDARLDGGGRRLGFTGGPDSARELLSAIASSTLTLAALVFSVTVIVLQLASGQFSPRVLRTFLRDQRNQATLGVFLATFMYALLVLREVRGEDGTADRFVPGIAVTCSFALVLLSIVLFIQYIHNITGSIRVIEIIDRVSRETAATIDRLHGEDAPSPPASQPPPAARTIHAETRGVVTSVSTDRLRRIAAGADVCLVVVPRVGDFVATGMPLVTVHGDPSALEAEDEHKIRGAVPLAKERDLVDDPAFGFRQLIDIAERALSPGVNDPTTAVQCLDHLHDLLRRLADRPLPPERVEVVDGVARVVAPQLTWDGYVNLALDEIRHWGADSIQVHRRITSMLDDLAGVVGPARAAVLDDQRRLLAARSEDLGPEQVSAARSQP